MNRNNAHRPSSHNYRASLYRRKILRLPCNNRILTTTYHHPYTLRIFVSHEQRKHVSTDI